MLMCSSGTLDFYQDLKVEISDFLCFVRKTKQRISDNFVSKIHLGHTNKVKTVLLYMVGSFIFRYVFFEIRQIQNYV